MTPSEFCYWLSGRLGNRAALSKADLDEVRELLTRVQFDDSVRSYPGGAETLRELGERIAKLEARPPERIIERRDRGSERIMC